jgi:hypothetical protein
VTHNSKPAYDQAQAQLDEALAHAFSTQLMGIVRGAWSPELFAAAERRNAAYGEFRAATDEAERAFSPDFFPWTRRCDSKCPIDSAQRQAMGAPFFA